MTVQNNNIQIMQVEIGSSTRGHFNRPHQLMTYQENK